jgi:hypothetical protein
MFGYIKTYKPEMKIREYDAYKAVYCTLCKQLKKDYGLFARFTLNFDYTFLAMIRMSAKKSEVSVCEGRCPYKPFAKCNHIECRDTELSFSAAVAMLMMYYKIKDTIADEPFFHRLLGYCLLPLAANWRKKATKRFPEIETMIRNFIHQQNQVEQSEQIGIDCFCEPTAHALAEIFSYDIADSATQRILWVLGYNIGKWVYLVDGLDDFISDRKKGRFNPYLRRLGNHASAKEVANFAKSQLNVCIDEGVKAYSLLNNKNFAPILENILVLGLEQVQNDVIRKVTNDE